NNAAINPAVSDKGLDSSRFEDVTFNDLQRELNVNLIGSVLCSKTFGTHFAQNEGGTIVNISSELAILGPDQRLYQQKDGIQTFFKSAAYGATKAAVLSLTQYLACYWAKNNIRVNAISPGGIENNQNVDFISKYSEKTPMGRMGAPQDLNGALIFLASDSSGYVTGHNLVVDGGWTTW
ncbi:MAG: SDR family oxidoreductase, partial [Proteobacteria bacterium]|nr:SDR family oxidoreductase [Pseudomonadota bacterium]